MHVAIFDIDGTLADCTHRQHHLTGGKKDWDAFYDGMAEDTPRADIVRLLSTCQADGWQIMLFTGRPDTHREKTEAWLAQHGIGYHRMWMRKGGDFRDDTVVKREMLAELRELGLQPTLVVDDRAKVVAMWRQEGLTCLQCAPGEF